jgi:hypothetical protein
LSGNASDVMTTFPKSRNNFVIRGSEVSRVMESLSNTYLWHVSCFVDIIRWVGYIVQITNRQLKNHPTRNHAGGNPGPGFTKENHQ